MPNGLVSHVLDLKHTRVASDSVLEHRKRPRMLTAANILSLLQLFREIQARCRPTKYSHRIAADTSKEDSMLCESWMVVGQDPICGARQ
jgi:hypothetical protein